MFDSLAAAKPRENLLFFGPALGWNDQRDVLADSFFGSITEDFFAAGFQEMIVPSSVLLTITSSEESTIAARYSAW